MVLRPLSVGVSGLGGCGLEGWLPCVQRLRLDSGLGHMGPGAGTGLPRARGNGTT